MPIFTGKLSEKNHPCAIFSSKMKHATIEKKTKTKTTTRKNKNTSHKTTEIRNIKLYYPIIILNIQLYVNLLFFKM